MKISEIFPSIDGEVNKHGQGTLTMFIRLAGCNLRCRYCDTPNSLTDFKAEEMTVNQVIVAIENMGCKKVTITGGEPMLQEETTDLIDILLDKGYAITVETNNTMVIPSRLLSSDVGWVFDYKLEFADRMIGNNLTQTLMNKDWVKIVVGDATEYQAAIDVKKRLCDKGCRARFAFSSIHSQLSPNDLIQWLIRDRQWDIVVNTQIHKLISVR